MAKDVAAAAGNATAGSDPLAPWLAPVRALSGVGPRLERSLARLFGLPEGGVPRCLDLLWHLPERVLDRRLLASPGAAAAGERVTLALRVERHQPAHGARRPYRIRCASALGGLQLLFFHAREAICARSCPRAPSAWSAAASAATASNGRSPIPS